MTMGQGVEAERRQKPFKAEEALLGGIEALGPAESRPPIWGHRVTDLLGSYSHISMVLGAADWLS